MKIWFNVGPPGARRVRRARLSSHLFVWGPRSIAITSLSGLGNTVPMTVQSSIYHHHCWRLRVTYISRYSNKRHGYARCQNISSIHSDTEWYPFRREGAWCPHSVTLESLWCETRRLAVGIWDQFIMCGMELPYWTQGYDSKAPRDNLRKWMLVMKQIHRARCWRSMACCYYDHLNCMRVMASLLWPTGFFPTKHPFSVTSPMSNYPIFPIAYRRPLQKGADVSISRMLHDEFKNPFLRIRSLQFLTLITQVFIMKY